MPYIVAKYLASKLVNLLIWWRFFLEKIVVFGLFGGGGEAVGYWLSLPSLRGTKQSKGWGQLQA